jgi:hypothetical protein
MMGKSCVDVLRDVTGDKSIEPVAEGLEKALGGGGALPEVTADDNGKVLTVVDGEWDKANSGGGGGGFEVVNISVNAGTFTNDMTYGEMSAALSEGKILVARLVDQYVNGTAFIVSNAGLSTSINCDIGGMKLIMRASSGDDNNVWSTVGD